MNRENNQINKYSQTPLYGYLLNTDTSLLRAACFIPGERKSLPSGGSRSSREGGEGGGGGPVIKTLR